MKKKLKTFVRFTLFLLLLVGVLFAINYALTPKLSGGEDFLVPWMGARTFLFEHNNPYTSDFSEEIQIEIYGHSARDGEYPYRLDIPFHLLFFYFPFALIKDFALARALWMSFAEMALFGVGLLSIYLADWKISNLNLTLFFTVLFFSFYGFYPLLAGSSAIFTALILLLSLIAFREKWDEILGILLLFSSIHLQNGGLLFFFLLFLIITSRRWRVLSISAMSLIVLLGITLIIFPDWMIPYASSLRANLRIGQGFLLSETLLIWRPDDGVLIAKIIKWVSLLLLIFEWRAVRGREFKHILWVASLSLVITPFLGIRISPALYPFLFFPIALTFKTVEDRWKRAKWFIPLALFMLLSTWGVFLFAPHALEILAFLFPFTLLLALYWMRWWLVRPPRMWADQL